jgi:hypothetical protein
MGLGECNLGDSTSHHWQDVALRADVDIVQGDLGGIAVRLHNGDYYYLAVSTDGQYELVRHRTAGGGQDDVLTYGRSTAIRVGNGVWNTLTLAAQGSRLPPNEPYAK